MKKIYSDILDFCLTQGIENSNKYLDILYLELKIYKNKLNTLTNEKPYWFQKRKIKEYNEEKEYLESIIKRKQQSILKELELIKKMMEN